MHKFLSYEVVSERIGTKQRAYTFGAVLSLPIKLDTTTRLDKCYSGDSHQREMACALTAR